MAAPVCLIAEPIHPAGIAVLTAAGVTVRHAATPDLDAHPSELADVDAIIVRHELRASAMDAAPRLAVIGNHGTGTDAVDLAHAAALGIPVVNTPTSNVDAVAEHAILLMLAVARQMIAADAATRRGEAGFRRARTLYSLRGRTLGVVGFGHTGQRVTALARGLGMRVIVWSPRADAALVESLGASRTDTLAALLGDADVVSLHRPLRADTRHTLDAAAFAVMKPSAIVVNTSRGGLIDEDALADAIEQGRLFGAGLDVLAREPMRPGSRLAALDRVVLTPHIAGSTQEALRETAVQCAAQVVDVLQGRRPASLVDPSVWGRRRPVHETQETPP